MPSVPPFVFRYGSILALACALTASFSLTQPSWAALGIPANAPPAASAPLLAQTPNSDLRPLAQGSSLLSVEGGRRLMEEAERAVSAQDYNKAEEKLQSARQVLNQVSNFYGDLAGAFSGIDSRVVTSQREKAVASAQMRDEATFRLALVHRAKNQPDLAVPLLVQIIRSQNPTQDLGKRAYQQLLELGFVDIQYPRSASPTP